MSKPSYAAVASKPTDGENSAPPAAPGQAGGPSEPPPPYDPTGPSRHPQQQPQGVHPQQQQVAHHPSFHPNHPHPHPEQGQTSHGVWVPPSSPAVARSRALRRFWVAFFWAWAVYLLIGLLVGGGISDIEQNPPGRNGHWGKHGRWHEDVSGAVTVASERVVSTGYLNGIKAFISGLFGMSERQME